MTISLKALRVDRGLKAEEIAFQLGVSVMTYRYWENGKHLHLRAVKKLADFYGIAPEEIREAGLRGEADESRRMCEKVED